jgi:putative endonuclease
MTQLWQREKRGRQDSVTVRTAFRKTARYRDAMLDPTYFAYIMASRSRTLYIGVTGDLLKRVFQHKQKKFAGFSSRYQCSRLVWFQRFAEVSDAIQPEKELKGWRRAKKIALIEAANPTWEDLSAAWYPGLRNDCRKAASVSS